VRGLRFKYNKNRVYVSKIITHTHFGGSANNGLNAGTFYWNLNNDASNLNRNIGTQLVVLSHKKRTKQ
jgi:hypothetical protein